MTKFASVTDDLGGVAPEAKYAGVFGRKVPGSKSYDWMKFRGVIWIVRGKSMSARNVLLWGIVCLPLVLPLRSFGGQTSAANAKDPKDTVLKAEHDLANAEIHLDWAALDRLYAENFTHTHTTGLVQSKAEYMKRLKDGISGLKAIDFSDETVRFFGGTTATVTGHVRVVSAHSPPAYDDTFLEVWVLEKGAWRCAAWAQARHPEEEKEIR